MKLQELPYGSQSRRRIRSELVCRGVNHRAHPWQLMLDELQSRGRRSRVGSHARVHGFMSVNGRLLQGLVIGRPQVGVVGDEGLRIGPLCGSEEIS